VFTESIEKITKIELRNSNVLKDYMNSRNFGFKYKFKFHLGSV